MSNSTPAVKPALIAPALIDAGHLLLRQVTEADLPALLEVNSNAEVNRFLPYALWQTLAEAQAWLQRWVTKGVPCDVLSFGLLAHEWQEWPGRQQ